MKRLPEHVGSIAAKTHAAKEANGKILGRFYATFAIDILKLLSMQLHWLQSLLKPWKSTLIH